MLKVIVSTSLILLLSFSIVASQAKVGTTGAHFLLLSPSVKANGMGQAGMTLTDANAYYFNPANLGLASAENNFSVSFYPVNSKSSNNVGLFNFSLAIPILHTKSKSSDYYIRGGYYFTKLTAEGLDERTYDQGTIDGTGRTFNWNDISHNFVISLTRTGTIDFAFGVTAKYLSQSTIEYTTGGVAFDVGGTIRYRIESSSDNNMTTYINPLFSFAVRNFGPSMTFINNSYPLPKILSTGFSFETGFRKQFSNKKKANIYNFIPVFDIEKHRDDYTVYKYGLDMSLYEIINLRIGKINRNGTSVSESTYGFTFSTFRLGKFRMLVSDKSSTSTGGLLGLLYNKLNVEYNFAQYDNNYLEPQNYHEVVFNYAL